MENLKIIFSDLKDRLLPNFESLTQQLELKLFCGLKGPQQDWPDLLVIGKHLSDGFVLSCSKM